MTCVDSDGARLALLPAGGIRMREDDLREIVYAYRNRKLSFATCLDQAIGKSALIFPPVNTPCSSNNSVKFVVCGVPTQTMGSERVQDHPVKEHGPGLYQ